jgi:hypothetical protein
LTGWCQKFKCGGIESRDNIKAMVELGGKFDAGCVTEAAGARRAVAFLIVADLTEIFLCDGTSFLVTMLRRNGLVPGTPAPDSKDAVFAPNTWMNDVMIPLSLTEDFEYRQAWGTQGTKGTKTYHDWDKSQVSNITIYMGKSGINAVITNKNTTTTLSQWTAMGNDPHSKQLNAWPSVPTIIDMAKQALGKW